MDGIVEPTLEAVVSIQIRAEAGTETLDAVVGTGFSGWLSLPSHAIRRLGLTWRRSGLAALADGTVIDVEVYDAQVEWHGEWRAIAVDEADTDPLVGMQLLRGSELRMAVIEGGRVAISPLPRDA